jgi:hypothetical protein
MSRNLLLVARNPHPKRELYHPDLWLIHTQGERPVEVHLSQDSSTAANWIRLDALDRSSLPNAASKRALD